MKQDQSRLLRALNVVHEAGSTLQPVWNPQTRLGIEYRANYSALINEELYSDLEELAREGYLEQIFIDRISLCPNCGSHALNVREVCLSCSSSNLTQIKTLFHFRCGYVGPASAFTQEAQGRRCPKCRKLLHDLGTDHDSPGDYFACNACNANFQVPEIGARCLSCSAGFSGTEMQRVRQRDVFAYRLLAPGVSAVSAQQLLEEEPSESLNDRV